MKKKKTKVVKRTKVKKTIVKTKPSAVPEPIESVVEEQPSQQETLQSLVHQWKCCASREMVGEAEVLRQKIQKLKKLVDKKPEADSI